MDRIPTYLVHGFLDAGKTSYIQEQIFGGFFHKRGSTLILAFEDGETPYDLDRLRDFRTEVAFCDGSEDVAGFCSAAVGRCRPDRIYVELNAMTPGLRERLPDILDVVFTVTLIDGTTLPLFYTNMRQPLQNMIADSHMAVFNRCADKDRLSSYGVPFRLMNPRCDFLWQSPMGYSEKAFGRLLPYDIGSPQLVISASDYPVFHLDSHENPQNYDGKTVCFDAQIVPRQDLPEGCVWLGRSVMTCCLLDIQFLGFECSVPDASALSQGCWLRVTADALLSSDRYRAPLLRLKLRRAERIAAPEQTVIGLQPAARA